MNTCCTAGGGAGALGAADVVAAPDGMVGMFTGGGTEAGGAPAGADEAGCC